MLILYRYVNEKIIIGENIKVSVLNVTQDQYGRYCCRIGIEAPKDIKIFREEVFEKIKNEDNKNNN